MSLPKLRTATEQDARAICALLENNGLPISDLASSKPEFVVACQGEEVIGTGAVQRFGSAALLRSVAVASNWRGRGMGHAIVTELERFAQTSRVTQLILLTQTASRFFEHQGYRVIDREGVPLEVRTSEEFRVLCPASAVCMAKPLGAPVVSGPPHG
jgi:amino-acid N-acetyltransferase